MHRIDGAGHINNTWVAEDPATNRPPTEITPEFMNAIQEEVVNVIEPKLPLDKNSNTQLLTAINMMIAEAVNGGDYKASVRVASTAAINLAAPGAAIDGVAMVAGDRFLEKDNATLADRGIYVWNGAAVPATRALDADTGAEFNGGAIIPVEQGTVNADTNWQITNDGVVTIGVTGLTFKQVGAQQSVASIQGAYKNLQASSTGLSANVTVTADEIVVEDATNAYKTLRAVNLTIAGTAVGVNGLDAGALAASIWYSVWVISNGVTTAGLLSLSATAPTLPAGYTYKARIGWIRTDGTANKYPLSFKQKGSRVQWALVAGSNLTSWPLIASGTASSFTAASVSSAVPPTALAVSGNILTTTLSGLVSISSNSVEVAAQYTNGNVTGYAWGVFEFYLLLESTNLYWSAPSGGGSLKILGWEDSL